MFRRLTTGGRKQGAALLGVISQDKESSYTDDPAARLSCTCELDARALRPEPAVFSQQA